MGFLADVAEVAKHPEILKLALRRAGNPVLAEDALQQTFWTVTQTQHPERITDLRAYFCRALINEINRQLSHPAPLSVEDIGAAADLDAEHGPSPRTSPPLSVESQAAERILAEKLLDHLDRHRDQLKARVPARSSDPMCYQAAVVLAARMLLCLFFQGEVTQADWNAVLKSTYPLWFDQLGPDDNASHQRLSRGRRDMKALLQTIAPRDELSA